MIIAPKASLPTKEYPTSTAVNADPLWCRNLQHMDQKNLIDRRNALSLPSIS